MIAMNNTRRRELLLSRYRRMVNERSSWLDHCRDVTKFLLPRAGRYFLAQRNQDQPPNSIIDDTATHAHSVLESGLMAGITSPARPWFRVKLDDLAEVMDHDLKSWLADTTKREQRVFSRSNVYPVLHQMYGELGAFGTACAIMVDDFDTIVRLIPLTAGEYCLAQNAKNEIDTMYREFELTVSQTVREFGIDNCSTSTRQLFADGQLDNPVRIVHAIEPREDRDPALLDKQNMPWASIYFEYGGDPDTLLREGGFDFFPVLAPRWHVNPGDIYGWGPGAQALGNIKQLQQEQLRKSQAIDYQVQPSLQIPGSLRNRDVNRLPGGTTTVDAAAQNAGVRPLWEVRLDLSHLTADLQEIRDRINKSFFADLFLMITFASDTTQRTASEIDERTNEKFVMLGPVFQRISGELLGPLIKNTFNRMARVGALLPPPRSIDSEQMQIGTGLSIEYVSMLAQAQRMTGAATNNRFVADMANVAALRPDVLDNLDVDKWAAKHSDAIGVDPDIMHSPESVAATRQSRNAALAAKEQTEMAAQQAGALSDVASAQQGAGAGSGLDQILGSLTGY